MNYSVEYFDENVDVEQEDNNENQIENSFASFKPGSSQHIDDENFELFKVPNEEFKNR